MTKSIFVGNLSFDAYEDDIRELFQQHGAVESVRLINDRTTGRFRGFGFVEMEDEAADTAIKALDGTEHMGRTLRVNEAEGRRDTREQRPSW